MDRPATFELHQILTEAEIAEVTTLFAKHKENGFAAAVQQLVVDPNLDRINQKLGRPLPPNYIAYGIEFLLRPRGARRTGPKWSQQMLKRR